MMRVIRVGGRAQREPLVYSAIAREWQVREGTICVIHGGGDEVSSLQRLMGIEPVFVGGRRVTGEADIDILRMGLSGASNKRIVAALQNEGARAVGISGEDAALIGASRTPDSRLGLVGTPERINSGILHLLLGGGFLPVISPMARSIENGEALNINGDDAAAAIAAAMKATDLLFVADVAGVLEGGTVIPSLSAGRVERLVGEGTASGGMIAKLEAALRALASGVHSVRIGGPEMISDPSVGTTITLTPSMV
jgi:acetylglutamate kinase